MTTQHLNTCEQVGFTFFSESTDVHYGAIANRAVLNLPSELSVSEKAQTLFQAAFGQSWTSALEAGLVFNAHGAASRLGVDSHGLGKPCHGIRITVTVTTFNVLRAGMAGDTKRKAC